MSSAAWNEVTALWSSWTITWVAWLRTRGAWSVPFRFSISNKDGLLQMDAYPSQALLNHVRRNYGWKQIWTNQPLFQWVSRKKRRPREENELDEHSSRGYNLIRKQNKPESTLLTPTSRRISLKRAVSLCAIHHCQWAGLDLYLKLFVLRSGEDVAVFKCQCAMSTGLTVTVLGQSIRNSYVMDHGRLRVWAAAIICAAIEVHWP